MSFASKDTVKRESSLDLRINSILIRRGRMSYHVLSEQETPEIKRQAYSASKYHSQYIAESLK